MGDFDHVSRVADALTGFVGTDASGVGGSFVAQVLKADQEITSAPSIPVSSGEPVLTVDAALKLAVASPRAVTQNGRVIAFQITTLISRVYLHAPKSTNLYIECCCKFL
jgi:hypothetical protein